MLSLVSRALHHRVPLSHPSTPLDARSQGIDPSLCERSRHCRRSQLSVAVLVAAALGGAGVGCVTSEAPRPVLCDPSALQRIVETPASTDGSDSLAVTARVLDACREPAALSELVRDSVAGIPRRRSANSGSVQEYISKACPGSAVVVGKLNALPLDDIAWGSFHGEIVATCATPNLRTLSAEEGAGIPWPTVVAAETFAWWLAENGIDASVAREVTRRILGAWLVCAPDLFGPRCQHALQRSSARIGPTRGGDPLLTLAAARASHPYYPELRVPDPDVSEIRVTREHVLVDGDVVAPILCHQGDGRPCPDRAKLSESSTLSIAPAARAPGAYVIPPLVRALSHTERRFRRAVVELDQAIPFDVVAALVHSIGMAGIDRTSFVVVTADREASPLRLLPLAAPRMPREDSPTINLTVLVDATSNTERSVQFKHKGGASLGLDRLVTPITWRPDEPVPLHTIYDRVRTIRTLHPDKTAKVMLTATPTTRWEDLAGVMSAVRVPLDPTAATSLAAFRQAKRVYAADGAPKSDRRARVLLVVADATPTDSQQQERVASTPAEQARSDRKRRPKVSIDTTLAGSCGGEELASWLRRRAGAFRGCYQQRLASKLSEAPAELEGVMHFACEFPAAGRCRLTAPSKPQPIFDLPLYSCVKRVLKRMKFRPTGQTPCKAEWSIAFRLK